MKLYVKMPVIGMISLLIWSVTYAQNHIELKQGDRQGDRIVTLINIENQDTIAGFQIPLYMGILGNNVKCDSISFVGSRVSSFQFLNSKVDTVGRTLYLEGIYQLSADSAPIPLLPGTGTLAKLYFRIVGTPGENKLSLVKGAIPDPIRDMSFQFWTPDAREVECSFKELEFDLTR